MLRLIIEALTVGLVIMAMGFPSSMIALKILPIKEGEDHIPVMYLSLFLTGVLSHIVLEILKLNLWYCKNGFACSE